MKRALLFAEVTLLTAAPAGRRRGWVAGEITTSFVYSRQFVDEHDLNGLRDKNSDIFTNSMLADVTFSVRDNLSVTLAIPIVSSKFVTAGTPRHPQSRTTAVITPRRRTCASTCATTCSTATTW
jgi:hypothetical protein